MTVTNRVLLFTLYLYALAAFTSTAVLAAYHIFITLLTIWCAIEAYRKKQFQLAISQKFLLAYTVVAVLSLAVNGKANLIGVELSSITRILAAGLMVFALQSFKQIPEWSKHARRILLLFLIATTIAHISGIIGLFSGYNPLKFKPAVDPTRAAGLYGMAITYGYGVQFLLLIWLAILLNYRSIWESLKEKAIAKSWLYVAAATTAAGLVLSLTRGAVIGFVCGLPFLFIKSSPRLFKAAMAAFAALAVVVATIMILMPAENRLSYRSESNMIRISQYQTAWYAFKEKPFWGHGYRQFSAEVGRIKQEQDIPFKEFVGNAHNNIVDALVGTGLIGFLCYLGFLFYWLKEIWQSNHYLKPFFLSVWIAFFISGQFQTTFTDAENSYLIFLLYGLSVLCGDQRPIRTVDA